MHAGQHSPHQLHRPSAGLVGLLRPDGQPADLVGTGVSGADATLQNTGPNGVITGAWIVQLNFKGSVQSKVQAITARLSGKNIGFAIVLDGVVESAPVIDSPFSASAQIQGSSANPFTQAQATDLANVLKYGALPLSFDPSQVLSISASLGQSSLQAGLVAGAIGLGLVLLYGFVYYRAMGLVTIISLGVSGLLVYASVTLLGQAIGFTLSLAGIAGLIVSIGITADSFVVFYERLKDEVREGRTVRSSVEKGWIRARRTILSADTVSFLAAVILYLVSLGDVRGFAFTLGVSTLLDIFTVFLFTKPLVTLLVQRPFFSTSRASGLAPGHAGIPRRSRPGIGAPKEA
ncbi:MAG: protein translocase subunit SecD [Mycobacteriales bacterium]